MELKRRFIILLYVLLVFNSLSYAQDKKIDSLDIKIGQMLMLGIGDVTSVGESDLIIKSIQQQKLGGILLYEKNISKENSFKNLNKLIYKYKSETSIPLLVSIDEEGGKVNRLKQKYGFPKTVSAKYLGDINSIDSTKYYSDVIARNLLELGINVNYAPVVDVHNPNNPPLGKNERSFSNNSKTITDHARQVVLSHRAFNVKTVLKHFPGHGNSKEDSHYNITDVSKYWEVREIFPYLKLLYEGNVDAIMTAHIVNEKLDASKLPATLSKKIMTDLLRKEIGFDGVIFSDDMQMKAISDHFGFEESIKMAIEAGVDILMFSNHIDVDKNKMILPEQIITVIKNYISKGELSEKRISESYQRILKFKKGIL